MTRTKDVRAAPKKCAPRDAALDRAALLRGVSCTRATAVILGDLLSTSFFSTTHLHHFDTMFSGLLQLVNRLVHRQIFTSSNSKRLFAYVQSFALYHKTLCVGEKICADARPRGTSDARPSCALRATTNPAAWRIACRRFTAGGLASGLDFIGRRKTSVSTTSCLAMPPDTNARLRETRNRTKIRDSACPLFDNRLRIGAKIDEQAKLAAG